MSTALMSPAPGKSRVLIVSGDPSVRERVRLCLHDTHAQIAEAGGGAEALEQLEQQPCELMLLDPELPDVQAGEVATLAQRRFPQLRVVPLTETFFHTLGTLAESDRPRAIEPSEASLPTPTTDPEVSAEPASTIGEGAALAEPLPGMIGSGAKMREVYRLARLVAPRDTTVLITGETGTGKELVARAIHQLSARADGNFVVVNCAAIPETLLEAELFGYVRGAFTGAVQSRLGRIHTAHGGTLFLDEAGELPLTMQAKLLRFLQCGEVQRLGSTDVFRVDVRVIAATNADLAELVARHQFRADLYWRLAVFPILLPPLRERVEDIVPLAEAFLDRLCQQNHCSPKRLSAGARSLLQRYHWPGNVRELHHAVERAFILAEGRREITADLFALRPESPGP